MSKALPHTSNSAVRYVIEQEQELASQSQPNEDAARALEVAGVLGSLLLSEIANLFVGSEYQIGKRKYDS